MNDVLLVVDVVSEFRHEDGDRLACCFAERAGALGDELEAARAAGVPIVHVNDNHRRVGRRPHGLRPVGGGAGSAGDAVARVAPREGDHVLFKLRYSGFDHSPLEPLLRQLEAERLLVAGTATERCVAQTAIAARERGFKVTILEHACAYVDAGDDEIALAYLERIGGCHVARRSALAGDRR